MNPRAILFDLLTGLIDSWSLWNQIAGSSEQGMAWRRAYLDLTYNAGAYQPYEDMVSRAAQAVNLPSEIATKLIDQWDRLAPWPEARHVVSVLQHTKRVGVVTNCSEALAQRAAARVGVEFDVLVSAERAGYYKPRSEPYALALEELGLEAAQVVYVAGSPYDVEAPAQLGMRVVWHDRAGLRVANVVPPGVKLISNLSELLL